MYAVRSNTGKPFRRSGVTFAPNQWKLLETLTPEQSAEAELRSLLIIEEVSGLNDSRLGAFAVDATEVDTESGDKAEVDTETLLASVFALTDERAILATQVTTLTDERDILEAEVSVLRERNIFLETEVARLMREADTKAEEPPDRLMQQIVEGGKAAAGRLEAEIAAQFVVTETGPETDVNQQPEPTVPTGAEKSIKEKK